MAPKDQASVTSRANGNDPKEQPQAMPAETITATTTTIASTTTTTLSGLGVTQATARMIRIRAPSMPVESPCFAIAMPASYPQTMKQRQKQRKRSVAVEVRGCVTKSPPPPAGANPTTLSWLPWGLGDNAGESHPAGIESTDQSYMTIQPHYPDFLVTPAGRCRRGWIGFEIPRTWRPDFVEYTAGDQSLTWPIKA
jgi:hypothetical protein